MDGWTDGWMSRSQQTKRMVLELVCPFSEGLFLHLVSNVARTRHRLQVDHVPDNALFFKLGVSSFTLGGWV